MKTNLMLSGLLMGGFLVGAPLAAPQTANVAFAKQELLNQAKFDEFAAKLPATYDADSRNLVLSRAGNAFDNGEARLFWFTDLDAARAQARRENKPILSLRLLGNLSDEFSCANSRLFRVLLYPNAAINRRLREDFVLHWSSERPVPVATIDMGDGRVFKRTLTGNSAHYLLSSDGQPLDVLPGLYAPAEFEKWLQRGSDFTRDLRAANVELRPKMLSDWHRGRLVDGTRAMSSGPLKDPKMVADQVNNVLEENLLLRKEPITKAPSARIASLTTVSKLIMEKPLLDSMEAQARGYVTRGGVTMIDGVPFIDGLFQSNAVPDNPKVVLDAATQARVLRMQSQNPVAKITGEQLIQTLEQSIARDTLNNRRNMEPAIHAYFVNVNKPDFVQLNRAIYDKLFRTPASDPWLGLAPADAFVALQNGGAQNVSSEQRVAQTP